MSKVIEVEGGTVDFESSPGHVNLIIDDGAVELRATEDECRELAVGVRENREVNVHLRSNEGVIAWEPGRGLYVEGYSTDSLYLTCSPLDREKLVEALREARAGT